MLGVGQCAVPTQLPSAACELRFLLISNMFFNFRILLYKLFSCFGCDCHLLVQFHDSSSAYLISTRRLHVHIAGCHTCSWQRSNDCASTQPATTVSRFSSCTDRQIFDVTTLSGAANLHYRISTADYDAQELCAACFLQYTNRNSIFNNTRCSCWQSRFHFRYFFPYYCPSYITVVPLIRY